MNNKPQYRTFNEFLFDKLWKGKNTFKARTLYIIIPLIMLVVLYILLYNHNALIVKNGYGFLDDLTNLFALTYVLVFIYYVSGYYTTYTTRIIEQYRDQLSTNDLKDFEKYEKNIDFPLYKILRHLASIFIAIIASLLFIRISSNNPNSWYTYMGSAIIYYKLLIIFCWYMAINVFFSTKNISRKLYRLTKYELDLSTENPDLSCGMKKFLRVNYINIGMAIYMIVWVAIIIISDQKAATFGIENAFRFSLENKNLIFSLGFVIIVLFTYLMVSLIPFFAAKNKLCEVVDKELEKYKYPENYAMIRKINRLKHSIYSRRNIGLTILTTLVPLIVAIIELLVVIFQSKPN